MDRSNFHFLLAVMILIGVAIFCAAAEDQASVTRITYVEGEAYLISGRGANMAPLVEDQVIKGGAEIITKAGGSVEMILADGSVLKIGPDTHVLIKKCGFVEVTNRSSNVFELFYGKVRAIVAPLVGDESVFTVETENATIGVRGTDFGVSHDRTLGETDVLCTDGSVELKPKDIVYKGLAPIIVKGDEGIRLIAGTIPEKPVKWLDDNKDVFLKDLQFKGKKTKNFIENNFKKIEKTGGKVINTIKEGGDKLKDGANRLFDKIKK